MPATPADPELRRQLRARLLALHPRAFELFAGDLLEYVGLRDVAVTRHSGDGGIDAYGTLVTPLLRIPVGVQVKRHRANVQRPDIDRFIGALVGRYAQGIFITTAGYGRQAMLKAGSTIPFVSTLDGNQVAELMLRHGLGIAEESAATSRLDEGYFDAFEAQVQGRGDALREQQAAYVVEPEAGTRVRPEDDLISLRALSHALRMDTTALRRWVEQGKLRADQPGAQLARGGYFFRRDRIEQLRRELLPIAPPASGPEWRTEFLAFARSRNLSKSYKPVLLLALLDLVDRRGEVSIAALVAAFRAFYLRRRAAGLPVEFGPPAVDDPAAVSDAALRQLILRHPLERFLIKGLLQHDAEAGVVRFAPQLWDELRAFDMLDLRQSAEEQLRHYYGRFR